MQYGEKKAAHLLRIDGDFGIRNTFLDGLV